MGIVEMIESFEGKDVYLSLRQTLNLFLAGKITSNVVSVEGETEIYQYDNYAGKNIYLDKQKPFNSNDLLRHIAD